MITNIIPGHQISNILATVGGFRLLNKEHVKAKCTLLNYTMFFF